MSRESPRPRRRPVQALVVAALLAACGGSNEPPGAGPPPAPLASPSPPPIVLISIDTLRSDRLPVYGYGGVETPAIDALRRDAILFERAYSHTPLTLPSHLTALTGLLPAEHGVRDNQGYRFVPGDGPYLPRELARRGYATGAAVSAAVLAAGTGLAAGWDLYDDRVPPAVPGVALGGVARPGDATLAAAAPWLRSVAGRPFFLLLHLFEPHLPYAPPEPFASRYESPYDGEIAAADRVVGGLVALLRELQLYERAVVLLMSDHGEGLGDHGEEEHGVFLYREALQVPLLLKLPGSRRAGESVARPVGLMDVYPTLLALAGGTPAAAGGAVSLLAAGGSDGAARGLYGETLYPRLHYGWSELTSLIRGRYHYIEAPRPELYDLEADPRERRDLMRQEPALAAELRRGLAAFELALEPPAAADEETRRRLAALGYLGGTSRDRGGALADPKAKIESLAELRRAFDHYRRGEPALAVPAFRAVLAENPGIVDGWRYLALALRRLGRLEESAEAYRGALAAAGEAPELRRGLARTLSEAGDQGAAEAELERLLAAAPEDAEAHEILGLVRLRQRRWQEARAASERAVGIDPRRPEAWNNLGVALYSSGRRGEALDAWERAVALDPELWDVLYNLGTGAAALGRGEQARRALASFVAGAPRDRYAADIRRARGLLAKLPG